MDCIFLNKAGTVLFARNDMEEGHWIRQEMNISAVFPFDPAKKIENGQRIAFHDPVDDTLQVFEINICTNLEPDHYQQITAENIAVPELSDEHINKKKFTAKTAGEAIADVLTGTVWNVGTNTASGTQDADISRGSVWDAVCTIQQNWNVYITPRIVITSGVITGRYLDIAPAGGTFRGLRLSIRKNLLDPSVTYDESEVYTALYGYGGTVEKPRTGQDDEPEELTFADVVWTQTDDHPAKPANQTYLEWPEKTALYGRNGRPRFGYYQNGNIKDADILLQKTWESLKQCADPKITISGGVVELRRLGYQDQPITLHDLAIIEIEETGETFYKEIVCCDTDLVDPSGTRVDIGDYIPSIVYINREEAKKSGGGGGGGKGPGSLTDLQEDLTYYDSEFLKDKQAIGMIVGVKNGDKYIKAASIVASINDDHGTNITLNADTINIGDLLTAISGEGITCTDLDCIGNVSVDQNIYCEGSITGYTITAENGLEILGGLLDCYDIDCNDIDAASLIVPDGELTVGSNAASWQTESVVTGTTVQTAGARWYATSTNGTSVTGNNYFNPVTVVTPSKKTIHFLGYSDS